MAPSPRSVFGCQRYRSPQQPRHSGLLITPLPGSKPWLAGSPHSSSHRFGCSGSSPKILFRYSGAPGRSCLTPRVGGQDRGASYDVESARETAVGKAASSLHKPPTGRGPSSLGPVAGHPHFDPVRGAGRRVRELVLLQFHYRVVVARLGQSRLRLLLRFGPYVCAAPVLQDARGGAVRRTIENPITVIAALSGLLGRHSHRCGLHLCLLGEFEASEQRTTGLSWQTWPPRQDRHPRPERG